MFSVRKKIRKTKNKNKTKNESKVETIIMMQRDRESEGPKEY